MHAQVHYNEFPTKQQKQRNKLGIKFFVKMNIPTCGSIIQKFLPLATWKPQFAFSSNTHQTKFSIMSKAAKQLQTTSWGSIIYVHHCFITSRASKHENKTQAIYDHTTHRITGLPGRIHFKYELCLMSYHPEHPSTYQNVFANICRLISKYDSMSFSGYVVEKFCMLALHYTGGKKFSVKMKCK